MYINNILKLFLRETAIETDNSFYLTDLENVVCFVDKNSFERINLPNSKELISKLLYFANTNVNAQLYSFSNSKEKIIPITDCDNKDWQSQIIFPVFIDDALFGSLVMVNATKVFDEEETVHHLKNMTDLVFKMLLNAIRENDAREIMEELDNEKN